MSFAGHAFAAMRSFEANRSLLKNNQRTALHSKTSWNIELTLDKEISSKEMEETRLRIKEQVKKDKKRLNFIGGILVVTFLILTYYLMT